MYYELSPYVPSHLLRSSTSGLRRGPKVNKKRRGEAAFCFYADKNGMICQIRSETQLLFTSTRAAATFIDTLTIFWPL